MEEKHSMEEMHSMEEKHSDEKGNDEEEYALPLTREGRYPGRRMLRGGLKEGMRKVASKPGA